MKPDRRLIVNADDYGLTAGVSRGILEAHRRGIVTSTTLLVNRPVDPALIGGLTVKVGSRLVDASVRSKLQSLKVAMKGVA